VLKDKQMQVAAIVHKDSTCRIQTVNRQNGIYFDLIKRFFEITKVPCILNTSFNVAGEPIVENPSQAIEDLLKSDMDYLIVEDYLIFKPNN